MEVKNGTIVKAIAGRDKDDFFVIVEKAQEYALIANGKSRKIEKPKRKNIKHLRTTKSLIALDDLTNKKLRKFLSEFNA